MSSDITLSAAVKQSLYVISQTSNRIPLTQSRLSTGLRIGSAIDDAVSYFQAKSITSRAEDMTAQKNAIDQGISTLKSALDGTNSIESLLKQAKGVLGSAQTLLKNGTYDEATQTIKVKDQDQAAMAVLQKQYNDLMGQINAVAGNSSYQGNNLLAKGKLEVPLGSSEANKLTVNGVDLSTKGLGLQNFNTKAGVSTGNSLGDLTSATVDAKGNITTGADVASAQVDTAINTVRASAAQFGAKSTTLQTRSDFTKEFINTLQGSGGRLTLTDLSSENANLLALQTRQQLSIQSLSIAGHQEQAILQLLR